MNRQQKESVIELLRKDFSTTKGSFFVDYRGLSVNQMQQLRRQLREKGGKLKIAKMRLIKRALGHVDGSDVLLPHCKNQLGVVFADDAAVVQQVAKTLSDFSKANGSLQLVIGCLDAQLLDKQAIVRIASLPSKEVLLAQLCGMLNMPASSLARGLNQLIARFLWALKELERTKAASGE